MQEVENDMADTIVVKGVLLSPTHLELATPVTGLAGEVEVEMRPVGKSEKKTARDLVEFLRTLPPGTRTKEDIDAQIREERESCE
jgi:hypothetical protein